MEWAINPEMTYLLERHDHSYTDSLYHIHRKYHLIFLNSNSHTLL
jgi:hypothetical protein